MTEHHNPYIVGNVVKWNRGFFGREDILRFVAAELRSPDQNSIVLTGQRRIGKTSILHELRRSLRPPQFVPILFDLMDKAEWPLRKVLAELIERMADAVELTVPRPLTFADDDKARQYFRHTFLPSVYARLDEGARLVLLFDEFDVLDTARAEMLSSQAAAEQFFPYLRELMGGEPRLAFVFVIGRNPNDLTLDAMATFKTSLTRRVSFLDKRSAESLVLMAEQQGSLHYTPPAVSRILELTSGHPYILQLLCHELWSEAHAAASPTVTIDVPQVDSIVQQALRTGEQVFDWIWEGLPPIERVLFSVIAEATSATPVVTREHIEQILRQHSIPLRGRELDVAPDTLVKWDLLRESSGGYAFCVEVLRQWIVQHRPLRVVKEELHRAGPRAEPLYQTAVGFYRQGNLKVAQEQLGHVIELNQQHVKARLLLGEIHAKVGHYTDAIAELELAYKSDPDEVRIPLVTVLLTQGDLLYNAGHYDLALQHYERALNLSPLEVSVNDRCVELWTDQANKLMGMGHFSAARELFEKAGKNAEVQRLAALIQSSEYLEQGLPVQALHTLVPVLTSDDIHSVRLVLRIADAMRGAHPLVRRQRIVRFFLQAFFCVVVGFLFGTLWQAPRQPGTGWWPIDYWSLRRTVPGSVVDAGVQDMHTTIILRGPDKVDVLPDLASPPPDMCVHPPDMLPPPASRYKFAPN